ncbi:MAG TPA: hypothetical protein VGY53_03375, partial [Isosphaeraceae bacterium]|nr:hypothetical protein [Isosphaeraceae bacterium]
MSLASRRLLMKRQPRPATYHSRRRQARSLHLESLETRYLLSTLRTLVYNEITSLTSAIVHTFGQPRLSASGNRAVFAPYQVVNGADHILVVNADGSGQTE